MRIIGPGRSFPGYHIAPASIDVVTGVVNGGDVNSIKSWQDGSLLDLQETAGTPALDVLVNFTGIYSFSRIGIGMQYKGGANHNLVVELYDFVDIQFKRLTQFPYDLTIDYKFKDIPITPEIARFNFIDNGDVIVRICHTQSGNVAHQTLIDLVTLIR